MSCRKYQIVGIVSYGFGCGSTFEGEERIKRLEILEVHLTRNGPARDIRES